MLLHHPNGTLSHFGGKTVGFIAFHGSIFSELGASSFPGAVQLDRCACRTNRGIPDLDRRVGRE
jgi:hypothetical protein